MNELVTEEQGSDFSKLVESFLCKDKGKRVNNLCICRVQSVGLSDWFPVPTLPKHVFFGNSARENSVIISLYSCFPPEE